MKCSYCGNDLNEQDSFCSFCGKPVKEGDSPEESKMQAFGEWMEGSREENPGEGGEPAAEAASVPPKKKSGGKIALIAVAAAVVMGVGALAVTKLMEKDPKEVVIAAFENIYTEDQVKPMEELFGISEFRQYGTISQQVETELVLEGCSEEMANQLAGGGIRTNVRYDAEGQKGSFDMGILFNNMDLMKLNLYYGDGMVMAAVPELSSRVFTLDVGEGLVERLENSPTLGPILAESDVDLEELAGFYEEYMAWVQAKLEDGTSGDPYGIRDVWKRYQEGSRAQENFKAALAVEKAGKGTFLMDGKEVTCKGYQVHVSKDSLIAFLRTSSDFFLQDKELKENFLENLRMSLRILEITGGGDVSSALGNLSPEEQLEENYEEVKASVEEAIDTLDRILSDTQMMVYVDPKGRLASVEGTISLTDEEEVAGVTFQLTLEGGSYLTQNARAKVVVTEKGEDVTFELVKQGTYDKNRLTGDLALELYGEEAEEHVGLMLSGTYDGESGDFTLRAEGESEQKKVLGLSAVGVVSELEKGSVLHVDMDELRVDVPDSDVLATAAGDVYVEFSGSYDLRPLSGEVTEPEGEKMDILAATEADWQRVMMEAYMGAMDIASQLGSVMN